MPDAITVDRHWYLARNPDVAQSSLDPDRHYWLHGRFEGRTPCALKAPTLETALWSTQGDALFQLEALIRQKGVDGAWANWVLMRWHAAHSEWGRVLTHWQQLMARPIGAELFPHAGPTMLAALAQRELGHLAEFEAMLATLPKDPTWDHALLRFALADNAGSLATLNALYRAEGLTPLRWCGEPGLLASLAPSRTWLGLYQQSVSGHQQGKVSVIVPARNAEATLPLALESLLAQSWQALEIIVVDDASTDMTATIADQFARRDDRLRLLRLPESRGAYGARNAGLQQAQGAFITTHDADDWSHPDKIARQIDLLITDNQKMATLSWWARVDDSLKVQCCERLQSTLLQPNLSSLLCRRDVFTALGGWDEVAVGADSEFWLRLKRVYGEQSVSMVCPGIPLALGLVTKNALTQQAGNHWRTLYGGVRHDYLATARTWHQQATDVCLVPGGQQRPFAVAARLLVDPARRVLASGWFDTTWYALRYPDVVSAGADPLQHYLRHGAAEGRDPHPAFSSTAYAMQQQLASTSNPLLDAIEREQPLELPLRMPGDRPSSSERPRMLVCAHLVQFPVFGAERSLLDLLVALERIGWDCIVALPSAANHDYIAAVKARAAELVFIPCPWWRAKQAPLSGTVAVFKALIERERINAVYANTLVLDEPLLAAEQCKVARVVHVRELPAHDSELCQTLQADEQTIRSHLMARADRLIANSESVARWLGATSQSLNVVHDAIDVRLFPENPQHHRALCVALIGSNHPKKGLDDFIALARLLAERLPSIECRLIGPSTPYLETLRSQGELPCNLVLAGSTDTPVQAQQQADIVVNLSHVEESFGRTVAEAMAGGRAVICYHWGALSELVIDGESGFLVRHGDIHAVAERIEQLACDEALRRAIGNTARARIAQHFGPAAFEKALCSALASIDRLSAC